MEVGIMVIRILKIPSQTATGVAAQLGWPLDGCRGCLCDCYLDTFMPFFIHAHTHSLIEIPAAG